MTDQSGFTIVETIVALAIVGMGFAYAAPSMSKGLGRVEHNRREFAAALVAQSMLERVGRDIALTPGEILGKTDGYSWRVATETYAGTPAGSALIGSLVTVTVTWREAGQTRSTALATVLLAPRVGG